MNFKILTQELNINPKRVVVISRLNFRVEMASPAPLMRLPRPLPTLKTDPNHRQSKLKFKTLLLDTRFYIQISELQATCSNGLGYLDILTKKHRRLPNLSHLRLPLNIAP